MTAREVAVAWLGLGVVCALAFAPHIRHGGFYSDDWANAALTFQGSGDSNLFNVISTFADIGLYRPVLVIYVPATYWVLGMHMDYHLAWVAILGMLAAWMLYGVLRTVGVPRIHAWIIAALTIVYPWFDSTRLWPTGGQVTLSVTLALAGLWIALGGIHRRSWRWHGVAAFLYLVSILTYEITLPVIAAYGLLYTSLSGWRAAKARWGVDLMVAAVGGLWVGLHTSRAKSDLAGNIAHLQEIITSGGTILGRTLLPVGGQWTSLALGVFLATFALGLITYVWRRDRFTHGLEWGLREWLLLGGAGVLAASLGWVMLIPADPYYTPSVYGVTNRVNGLAGIGLVVAAYAMFGLAGTLIGQLRARANTLAVITTLALSVALGTAYVDVLRRHTQIWDAAYIAERSGLEQIRAQFPQLPHRMTLFASGYPANQTLGVPIFSSTWDLQGMIRGMYDDGTLSAYPVLPGTRLECRAKGIQMEGEDLSGEAARVVPYGEAQLFHLETNMRSRPSGPEECRAVVTYYLPGPLYLSYTY